MSDDKIDELFNIMQRSGSPNVPRAFAALLENKDVGPQGERLLEALTAADQRLVVEADRTEPEEIAKLTPDQRETMAILGLAGYRFIRGMFYWRVISPDNFTVDSLQPDLARAIGKAHFHNEERTNGYSHK